MRLRNIFIVSFLVSTVAFAGCGKKNADLEAQAETKEQKTVTVTVSSEENGHSVGGNDSGITEMKAEDVSIGESEENEEKKSPDAFTEKAVEDLAEDAKTSDFLKASGGIWSSKDPEEVFGYDFTEDIKNDVAHASASAGSLQEELSKVDEVTRKYDELFRIGEAQLDLNMAAAWTYDIWDAELNSLWSRFSESADTSARERVLKDERNWISMKEEVTIENLGRRVDGGSMYPLLEYSFLEEISRNRCFILAGELAKIKGETFVMPEREIYGTYVDNQGTGEVYSSLITRKGWENEDEAIVSLHRLGMFFGTFTDKGNGELSFETNDETIKGIIHINGWSGADFEVTESKNDVLTAGEKYNFDFAF